MKKAVIVGFMVVLVLGAGGLLAKHNRDVKTADGNKIAEIEEDVETPVEEPKEVVETPVEEIEIEEVVETPVEEIEEPEAVVEPVVEEKEPVVEVKEPVIAIKIEKKDSTIGFKEVKKNDSTLEIGKTAVVQNGVNGVETVTYSVTYTDGKETARVEKSRVVTKASVDKIVSVGTKAVAVAPKPVEPKPEPIVVPEPVVTPAPAPTTPAPAYGTTVMSLPTAVNGVDKWQYAIITYEWEVLSGIGYWSTMYNGSVRDDAEWMKYAFTAFPIPTREGKEGEQVKASVWVWLK